MYKKEGTVIGMAFKIGFAAETPAEETNEVMPAARKAQAEPRKSVVQVFFPERGREYAYYNDMFDLKCGDLVYVEGKLEGQLGRVREVNYNFRIRLSDYKRVIALVDTDVHGRFRVAGSHFVTFDRETLPRNRAVTWFKAPPKEDEVFVGGRDDTSFLLTDLGGMGVTSQTAERGHEYYVENKVKYISVDGTEGYAVVEGSEAYEVEFEYRNGEISGLVCSCFCCGICKHEFAAMLQLRETLELIGKNFADEYGRTGYFAAINKATLFAFAVEGKESVEITL